MDTVLAFPVRPDHVCLGYKTAGFGADRWNGFGGKIEPGETSVAAATRELAEETGCGVAEQDLSFVADLTFFHGGGIGVDIHMHVFTFDATTHEPREVEKMRPQWFPISAVPYEHMWADDRYWLPHILAGERLSGVFWYDRAGQKVLRHELSPL
jgi:8-oxo-dGTP diphosphatase